MPNPPKSKLLLPLLAAIALLALPAAAQATLVFTKQPLNSTVYAANDDGSGIHKIGKGTQPDVSPDGTQVAYYHEGPGHAAELLVAPTAGGKSKQLLPAWRETFIFAWSADSTTVAAVTGAELGKKRLVTVDIASGKQTTIAKGYFSGVSFSPDSTELAYSKASSEKYPPKSDVYAANLASGRSVPLTKDHVSTAPLWGPNDTIVFDKYLDAKKRKYGPKLELFLMNGAGQGVKRLTHTKVEPLLSGLGPTAWSESGKQLLAEFGGQDTSYAVTVDPKTGKERALTPEREIGFVGAALSKDGSTVLGSVGEFEGNVAGRKVQTIPYAGGKPKTLVTNASEPDWSR
jgi:Tol biopolymer transport system component